MGEDKCHCRNDFIGVLLVVVQPVSAEIGTKGDVIRSMKGITFETPQVRTSDISPVGTLIMNGADLFLAGE